MPLSKLPSSPWLSSDSESTPKAGTSYSGSSYFCWWGESCASPDDPVPAAVPSSESFGLFGGAGGGTLGLVKVLVRLFKLGFFRLSI